MFAKGAVWCLRPQARPQVAQRRRGALVIRAATCTSNDFKNGLSIEVDGNPFKITEFLHVKPGKGAAFVRSKLKSYLTGNTVERTFRAGETVTLADIERKDVQFTYVDGDTHVFMDMATFEEVRIPSGSWAKWLKEGSEVTCVFWQGKSLSVDVPLTLELKVERTDPGVKGNTAQGGSKPATLETGAQINVPLFIEEGELIKVNTENNEYLGRVKEDK
ncbi:unnamed protein product [Pedinophyceae sp. YPF-701]|nr:unnamed protein product [Pedinophyceae sp. YPF-701]